MTRWNEAPATPLTAARSRHGREYGGATPALTWTVQVVAQSAAIPGDILTNIEMSSVRAS